MTLHDERAALKSERFEIVRGEVVPLLPTGDVHGNVKSVVVWLLTNLQMAGLGLAFGGETGVIVEHEPRTVRGADGAFLLQEQLPHRTSPEGYLLTPPALVVEVVSPNDSAAEIDTKVLEYLSAGVKVVWVVYPASRTLTVHLQNRSSFKLQGDDPLYAPDVLTLDARLSILFKGLDAFEASRSPQPPAAP